MASRQKSFFDQSTKTAQWHAFRKPFHVNRAPELPNRPAAAMAPIVASSQSKSKLRAFQFDGSKPSFHGGLSIDDAEAGKENVDSFRDEGKVTVTHQAPRGQTLSQRSAGKEARECPQTPVGRLALAELIASGEDLNHQHLNLTPVERVLWDQSPRNSDPPSSAISRKGKKRAHSSSPASSQNETSNHFTAAKPSLDLQTLQKCLTTPQADPANDLWSRYSVTNERQSPKAKISPPFAHLLNSSSPQTPASHLQTKDSACLRRSVSCTTEWPTSATKRRKIEHSRNHEEAGLGFAATEGANTGRSTSKRSRVSLLVDRLHDELAGSVKAGGKDIVGPSSSSPLPEKGGFSQVARNAALRSSQIEGYDHTSQTVKYQEVTTSQHSSQPREISAGLEDVKGMEADSSSDFGDDDLELEMLKAVDADMEDDSSATLLETAQLLDDQSGGSGRRYGRSKEPTGATNAQPLDCRDATFGISKANSESKDGRRRSNEAADLNAARSQSPQTTTLAIYDEFDEDGNDVSAADFENAVALYDLQPHDHTVERCRSGSKDPIPRKPSGICAAGDTSSATSRSFPGNGESEVVDLSSDDEFGGALDFEDIIAECAEATRAPQVASQPQSSHDKRIPTIQRYLIVTVAEGEYETSRGPQPEKVLLVQNEKTRQNKAITVRQSWFDSPYSPGSYVHLIGDFDQAGQCVVDEVQNLLILHPDHLISATVVADSFSCTRRAVLQDRVKATSESSEPQIYGHILHEIFQEAMKANRWDAEWLTIVIEKVAMRYLETLFEINVELVRAVDHLKSKVTDLQSWAEVFITARPKPNAVVQDRNGARTLMSVNKLLEVEEKVWSPMYGLKGNVDATVQVCLKDSTGEKTLTVPFELKTGKHANPSHKAQTALYTLLLSDRYDVEIACGILYYMETSEISRIPAIRYELIHMLIQRNKLAAYVRQRLELPPMLKSVHLCNKCYAQTPCFIYHKLLDGGNGDTSGMKEKFDDVVKHLNLKHQQFFVKWDDLLTKEEKDVVRFRRELWTMQSSEREKMGRCFGNVVIEPGSFEELKDAPKINRYRYTFMKQKPFPGFSFTESQISTGEPIVISDEKGHFALANGYVTSVRKRKIQVVIDRQLRNGRSRGKNFDSTRNQDFAGIMVVAEDGCRQAASTPPQPDEGVSYRLDKDEFSNGMAMVRNNLIALMDKDVFGTQALRRLIIEGITPTFRPTAQLTLADGASQANLNVDQQCAIEKVMSAKDYALVLGMPGTGKTTTIAHIIRALTAQGKSVLLTSYTHTAVDNILLKIRNDNIGVFRLGAVAKVHPEVQEFADLAGLPMKTVEDIERAYGRQVVATTCLGTNHPIFSQRIFDYCIVDEASQITLPVCLGPIRMARTFILVGDHYQLPPLVQNKEAIDGGLDVSLFKTLSENHPSSVVNLEHQYRMCSDIMALSNILIYNGRLKCGTTAVANRSLNIPNINALKLHHHNPSTILSITPRKKVCINPTRGSCWLRDLLDPSIKACLVNTDPLLPLSRESEEGSRITNPVEATITAQLIEALVTTGVPATDIGVITLYRSQLALIKQNLRHRPEVEMHTADRFQGRDKDVIVLSLVRNNEQKNVGMLLEDWRRVNVAFTRARTKLLVLGSRRTLAGNELLGRFVRLMDEKRWRYDLPVGATESHLFEDCATQLTGMGSGDMEKSVEADVKAKPKAEQVLSKEDGERKAKAKGMKKPLKQGTLNPRALLGSRPVLRDIINDAS